MKIKATVTCLCETNNEIVFRKPGLLTPTTHKMQCRECGSTTIYKLLKPKKSDNPNKFAIEVKPMKVFASEILIEAMLAAEKEAEEKKTAEQEDAQIEKFANEFMDENLDLMKSLAEQEKLDESR